MIRTLVLATVAVPIVIYGLMPRLHKIRGHILMRRATALSALKSLGRAKASPHEFNDLLLPCGVSPGPLHLTVRETWVVPGCSFTRPVSLHPQVVGPPIGIEYTSVPSSHSEGSSDSSRHSIGAESLS